MAVAVCHIFFSLSILSLSPTLATGSLGRGFSQSHCVRPSTVRVVSFPPCPDFQKKEKHGLGLGSGFDG